MQDHGAALPCQQRYHLHSFSQAGAGGQKPGFNAPQNVTVAHSGGSCTHHNAPHHPTVPGGLGEHPTVGFRMNFSPTPQNTSLHPKEPPLSPAHRTWSSQRVPSRAESHFSSAAAPGSHGMGFQRGGRPSPPGGLGIPRVRPVPLTRQAECPQLQVSKLDVGECGQLGRVSQHTGPTAPQQQRLQAPGGHRKPRVGPGRGNTLSPPGTPWDPPHILAAWL